MFFKNKILYTLVAICCIALPAALCSFMYQSTGDKGKYRLFIIQDSIRYEMNYSDTTLKLKKKPFKFELHLAQGFEGAFVSASYEKLYYDTPVKRHFKDWDAIGAKTMVEAKENEDKTLVTSPEYVCFWYYENGKPYRTDPKTRTEDNRIVLTKSIKKISEQGEDKIYVISEVSKPLYVVSFYKNFDTPKALDLERKRIKIVFE
jgi:hypothetical protein